MLPHLIYLHYIAFVTNVDIQMYEELCVDRWGILFRYFAVGKKQLFMKQLKYQ